MKAALLYADRVTLASPKALMMLSIASFGNLDPPQRRHVIDGFVGKLNAASGREYERLRSAPDVSAQVRRLLRLMEGEDMADTEFRGEVEEILVAAGAREIGEAIAAGLVDIHPLGFQQTDLSPAAITVITDEMAALLHSSVSASARTFPLFDDGAGNMLRSMVDGGKLFDPHRSRAAEAGVAGRLIGELEAFPRADMSDILDVRERLKKPLVHFRAALAIASAEFSAAAWDESFAREVDDLYRREVEPAVLEIKEGLRELGARPTLLRLASGKEAVVAAVLGLAAAGGVVHGDLPQLLYSGGIGVSVAVASATEALQQRGIRTRAEQNALYLLYQAQRDLTD